jgi:hypothetical protein
MAGGIHFTTTDGTVYFVRDEVLEACQLSGEELEGAQKDLSKDHDPVITDSVHIDRDDMPALEFSAVGGGEDELASAVAPTVMCCW